MKQGFSVVLACLAVAGLVGCGSAETSSPLDRVEGTKDSHEFRKIFHRAVEGSSREQNHVGYSDRIFTDVDPDGITYVMDLKFERKGFVLPSGAAYRYEIRGDEVDTVELGNTGFVNGVKGILGLRGQITLEVATLDGE